jgi:imidazole glycerol-phosphate synthase subunit HisH
MIGIIDYGMGNLSSVKNVLDYLDIDAKIVKIPSEIESLTHLIIPGVGSFALAMENLHRKGFVSEIRKFAKEGKPVLGICLGMQLLAEKGTEPHESAGLGLISGTVELMQPLNAPIPHMGWNGISIINNHPILEDVKLSADFYFVHSYAFVTTHIQNIVTQTEYEVNFPSIVTNERRNVIGIQFHPEKSQKQGLKIIENFSKLGNA